MHYHTHDSRRSPSGFPDLVIVFPRTGALLIAELKSATGKVSAAQQKWIEALDGSPAGVHVWRPEHWPQPILDVLQRCACQVIR
jgi:hypothetical protein